MIVGYSKHERNTKKTCCTPKNTPTSPQRPPLHTRHFLLSPRWQLWRGSTVFPFFFFFLPIFCSLRCFLAIMVTPHGQVLPVIVSLTWTGVFESPCLSDLLCISSGRCTHFSIECHGWNSVSLAKFIMFI